MQRIEDLEFHHTWQKKKRKKKKKKCTFASYKLLVLHGGQTGEAEFVQFCFEGNFKAILNLETLSVLQSRPD